MIDHSAYDPNPVGRYATYCPACLRVVRCGPVAPLYPSPSYYRLLHDAQLTQPPVFYRHYLDPGAPRGERDRCMNSRQPVAEAYFCRDDGRLVPRAQWEAAQ